jgi:hypothetical protein
MGVNGYAFGRGDARGFDSQVARIGEVIEHENQAGFRQRRPARLQIVFIGQAEVVTVGDHPLMAPVAAPALHVYHPHPSGIFGQQRRYRVKTKDLAHAAPRPAPGSTCC